MASEETSSGRGRGRREHVSSEESAHPRAQGLFDWGGIASFTGGIATVRKPTRVVERLLPPALRLGNHGLARHVANEHPLVFLFGEMTRGGAHVGGIDFSSNFSYREVAVMIPWVVHERTHAVFSRQMFADDLRPVLLGNSVYGLQKKLAAIECGGVSYRAGPRERPLFSCSGALFDSWCRWGDGTQKGLAWLDRTFALPVVGLHASGRIISSRFVWGHDDARACSLVAEGVWRPQGEAEALEWRSDPAHSFVVSGLRWRTSAPDWSQSDRGSR